MFVLLLQEWSTKTVEEVASKASSLNYLLNIVQFEILLNLSLKAKSAFREVKAQDQPKSAKVPGPPRKDERNI